MKWVVVPQEVRTPGCTSYLMKAEPAGQERPRVPPRQGPYGAGGSEGTGRVMEPRNGERCGEPTVSSGWQAAVLGALWRVRRTPPGSESGACLQRGHAGTWESHRCPCPHARSGGPGDQRPWRGLGASTRPRALRGDHERGKHARDRGTSAKRSTPSRTGGSRRVAEDR
jgi:hypothetical protein